VCSQIKLVCVAVSSCRWRASRRVGAIEFEFAGRDEKKFRALKLRAEAAGLDRRQLSKKLLTEGDAFDAGASIHLICAPCEAWPTLPNGAAESATPLSEPDD
jgi:hypothetical protein